MPHTTLPSSRDFITQLLNSLPPFPQHSASATNNPPSNPLDSAPEPARKQLLTLHVLFPNEFLPALDLLDRHLVTRFHIRRNQSYIAKEAAPQEDVARTKSDAPHIHGEAQGEAVSQAAYERTKQPDESSALSSAITRFRQTSTGDVEMLDSGIAPLHPGKSEGSASLPQMADREGQAVQESTGFTAKDDLDTVYYVRSAQQRSSRYGSSYDSNTSYEVRLAAWNCSCPAFAFAAFPSMHPEPPIPVCEVRKERHGNQDVVISFRMEQKRADWIFGGKSLGEGMPPVCKHLLACALVERCAGIFGSFVEDKEVSIEEAAGWAAGWGD